MMRKLWLAVVLGVVLGLGITKGPGSIVMEESAKQQFPMVAANLRPQPEVPYSPALRLLLAVLVGIATALSTFMLAKRRYG